VKFARNGRNSLGGGAGALRGGVVAAVAVVMVAIACSNSGSSDAGGNDAGTAGFDGACGPLPQSLTVAALLDCVATVPNPCCTGFHAYACAATLDGGGSQCSETTTCVRAARYDQSLCMGAQAYSCPDLNGTNYATMTSPSCEQMEAVGPAGEGIRWCCGSNLPPAGSLDAATPPPVTDAAATDAATPGTDSATGDATTD
jgi:hypothetical protein